MSKKRLIMNILLILAAAAVILMGVRLFQDRKYNLISISMAFLSCVPFYMAYEKREGSIRRMVVLAVMVAVSVAGRLVFVVTPGFKPVTAIVVIAAIYMGSESGFLIGSLSAIISNMFYGQGPWTPFQMLAWGSLGLIAGLPVMQKILKNRGILAVYGFLAGFGYSAIMDIWSVLSFDGSFSLVRYLTVLAAALPVSMEYAVSNVVFLMLGVGPIGRKLKRINIKHGIFY
ncbi:ECF transporter S component [uncultured Robinsoniella sp.]|uniref:ECF transporter S component n=1 Tax=uncultured Robinsoniella sp. TaxID=904190 RepID=UPI00374F400C